jgi:hypothetical protein
MLNYGYEPTIPLTMTGHCVIAPAAHSYFNERSKAIAQAKTHLTKAKGHQKRRADVRRRTVTFQVGDYVRLNTENIRFANNIPRKLLPRFTRPFRIIRKISDVTYKLALPENWRIYNIFHVSLLRPFSNPNSVFPNRRRQYPDPEIVDDHPEYEIEKIIHNQRRG